MGGAIRQGVCLMKGKIALYAGYFVAMLLLASYFTGVLQQGILPRFRHQETAPEHNEQSAVSDQQPASQESDKASETGSAAEGQTLSQPPEDKSAVPPTPQNPVVISSNPPVASLSNALKQTSASTGPPSSPPPGGSEKPVPSRVEGSAAADRQEKLLAEKRAELLRLEEQIRQRKEESEVEGKWVAELKASGAKLTKDQDTRREAGIQKLAKLYEGMDPDAAASILSKLEKNMAAKVLASMKDRSASKVLAAMNGQKAKDLSERLQEIRPVVSPPNSADQTSGQGKAPLDQAQGRPRPGSGQAVAEAP